MVDGKLEIAYLDEKLGLYCSEKSGAVIEEIFARLDQQPSVRTLDIGPGGGVVEESVAALVEATGISPSVHFDIVELFKPTSLRLAKAMAALRKQGVTTNYTIANMTALPFKNESMDVINASAVLHEVHSYGAPGSVEKAFSETARILKLGGVLVYRDMYGVTENLHEPFEQMYTEDSWIKFTSWFLPYYLQHAKHTYEQDDVILESASEGLRLVSPVGMAREIQRHYLTFRDHSWRFKLLGIWPKDVATQIEKLNTDPDSSDRLYFECDPSNQAIQELLENVPFVHDQNGAWMKAETFDYLSDRMLAKVLDNPDRSIVHQCNVWLEREGPESYIYCSPQSLVETARQESFCPEDRTLLTPVHDSDTEIYERSYYTDYLKRTLGEGALADSKLAVRFRKVAV